MSNQPFDDNGKAHESAGTNPALMTAEEFYKQNPDGDIYAFRMATLSVVERNKYNRELLEDSGVINAMVEAMYESHRQGKNQYEATIAAAKKHLRLGE